MREIDQIPLGDGIQTNLLDFGDMKNIPPEMKKELRLTDADQEYFSGTSKIRFGAFIPQKIPDKFSYEEIPKSENLVSKI